MKKLFALLFIIAVAITISSCGPNSKYFKINVTHDVKSNQAIEIDTFSDILVDNLDLLRDADIQLHKRTNDPEKYYRVEVEYRKNGSSSFRKFDLKDEKYIYEADPEVEGAKLSLFGTYDFKVHFINTATNNDEDTINFYVTYTFMPAMEAKADSVEVKVNKAYNLLDNINAVDENIEELSAEKIKEAYDIEATVTQGEKTDLSDNVNYKYEITFTDSGTYHVKLQLTEKTGADGGTSASPGAGETEAKVVVVEFDIVVK